MISPQIENTDDGSQTLIHPILGERYHSTRGALGESLHVFIEAGLNNILNSNKLCNHNSNHDIGGRMCNHDIGGKFGDSNSDLKPINILEIGFGSGLNALLTAHEALKQRRVINYQAIELYPVDIATTSQLTYASDPVFMHIHSCDWGCEVDINPYFKLKKLETNLIGFVFDSTFDLVYFDAFDSETQPEMWSHEVFQMIYTSMNVGAQLVTYSAKGSVKESLRTVGFEVKRLPGALGKRHMLRATKI